MRIRLGIAVAFAVLVAVGAALMSPVEAAPPSNSGWTLTFEDNFDTLDTGIWDVREGPWKDGYNRPTNAFTRNGNLVLRVSRNDATNTYDAGFIRTRKGGNYTFSQKYGYFEARIRNTAKTGYDLVPQVPEYLKLSTEVVTGSWAGNIDPRLLPNDTLIDYVRVYQRSGPAPGPPPSPDPTPDPTPAPDPTPDPTPGGGVVEGESMTSDGRVVAVDVAGASGADSSLTSRCPHSDGRSSGRVAAMVTVVSSESLTGTE